MFFDEDMNNDQMPASDATTTEETPAAEGDNAEAPAEDNKAEGDNAEAPAEETPAA